MSNKSKRNRPSPRPRVNARREFPTEYAEAQKATEEMEVGLNKLLDVARMYINQYDGDRVLSLSKFYSDSLDTDSMEDLTKDSAVTNLILAVHRVAELELKLAQATDGQNRSVAL